MDIISAYIVCVEFLLCHNNQKPFNKLVLIFFLFYSPDYNVEFFRQFTLVMNALDNRGEISTFFMALFLR